MDCSSVIGILCIFVGGDLVRNTAAIKGVQLEIQRCREKTTTVLFQPTGNFFFTKPVLLGIANPFNLTFMRFQLRYF